MPTIFVALTDVKKRDPRRPRNRYAEGKDALKNVVSVVAPRSNPNLADGLDIGAMYEHEPKNLLWRCIEGSSQRGYFFDWCRILTIIIAGSGRFIRKCTQDEWIDEVAGALEDEQKYAATGGRGPFWELVRYGLRGVTFGPVVCAKLTRDFDEWEPVMKAHGDEQFYELYLTLRECFAYSSGTGLVYYEDPDYFAESDSDDRPLLGVGPLH